MTKIKLFFVAILMILLAVFLSFVFSEQLVLDSNQKQYTKTYKVRENDSLIQSFYCRHNNLSSIGLGVPYSALGDNGSLLITLSRSSDHKVYRKINLSQKEIDKIAYANYFFNALNTKSYDTWPATVGKYRLLSFKPISKSKNIRFNLIITIKGKGIVTFYANNKPIDLGYVNYNGAGQLGSLTYALYFKTVPFKEISKLTKYKPFPANTTLFYLGLMILWPIIAVTLIALF
ncbi:MAG: hypothetical protein C4562_05780 [Actinobacteria bacterium]|nr:MAG: hypothetical protein C4562_05780 [Actinomycetota bacterium]